MIAISRYCDTQVNLSDHLVDLAHIVLIVTSKG